MNVKQFNGSFYLEAQSKLTLLLDLRYKKSPSPIGVAIEEGLG